jgi:hypothetical protein
VTITLLCFQPETWLNPKVLPRKAVGDGAFPWGKIDLPRQGRHNFESVFAGLL